jgi:phage terminase small subunit
MEKNKMPRLKRLSLKQRGFCKTFVENKGNATEAALAHYNVKNRHMATVVGSLNLDKPMIKNEIERLMEDKLITDGVMMDKLKEGMDANVVSSFQGEANESDIPDHDKRFKWWDAAAKIKGLYPPAETLNKNLNLDVQLESMPKEEFAKLLKAMLLETKKQESND